jgi:hypothetical protein
MRVLQREFSRKEKAERLLSNLKKLKREGVVDEDQYDALRKKYASAVEAASNAITARKDELKGQLQEAESSRAVLQQQVKDLEVKFKVGELPADQYQRLERSTSHRLAKTIQQIATLQKALSSSSSEDVGGFIDIDLEGKGAAAKLGEIEQVTGPLWAGEPGTLRGHLQDAIGVVKNPMAFFEQMRVGTGLLEPLIFGGGVCLVTAFLKSLFHQLALGTGILYFFSLAVGVVLASIVILILTKVLKGEGDLESSLRIVAYSSVPIIAWFIPYLGIIISLYGVYILFAGLQKLHGLTPEKSAVGVLVVAVIYALLRYLWR